MIHIADVYVVGAFQQTSILACKRTYAVQCSAVQCSAAQCSAVQYPAVQCSTVQYRAVQCSAVRFLTLQYSSVLCKFRDQLNRDGHRQDSGGNVTFSIELVLPPQLTPAANVLPMHLHMWAVST